MLLFGLFYVQMQAKLVVTYVTIVRFNFCSGYVQTEDSQKGHCEVIYMPQI